VAGGTLSTLRLLQRATPLRRIDPSSHHRRAYETRAGDVPLARCGCDREASYHTRERHTVLHLASQSRRVAGSDCGSCRSSIPIASGALRRRSLLAGGRSPPDEVPRGASVGARAFRFESVRANAPGFCPVHRWARPSRFDKPVGRAVKPLRIWLVGFGMVGRLVGALDFAGRAARQRARC